MRIVPGPAAGEGCSSDEGGCASCPYMKMNSLDALLRVAGLIGTEAGEAMLAAHAPRTYAGAAEGEASVAARGCVPILHMRDFQRDGAFSERFAGGRPDQGGQGEGGVSERSEARAWVPRGRKWFFFRD